MSTRTVTVDVPETEYQPTEYIVRCGSSSISITKTYPRNFEDAHWYIDKGAYTTFEKALEAAKVEVEKKELKRIMTWKVDEL